MNSIYKSSLANSIYFSFATLLTIWISNWLYDYLYKTTGRINIALLLFIVVAIILIMFFVSLTHILVRSGKTGEKIVFSQRILGVILFIGVSAIIVGIIGLLVFIPI